MLAEHFVDLCCRVASREELCAKKVSVVAQVVLDKGGDKKVTVVVIGLLAVHRGNALVRVDGLLPLVRLELLAEGISRTLE